MRCLACGAAEVTVNSRDIPAGCAGATALLPMVIGIWCSQCGEVVVTGLEAQRVSTIMLSVETKKQRVVDRSFVRQVRRKLALDQRQAAAIFGGGINAFSRYEGGITTPSVALIKLLVLLDQHPELLKEIRAEYPYASDPQ